MSGAHSPGPWRVENILNSAHGASTDIVADTGAGKNTVIATVYTVTPDAAIHGDAFGHDLVAQHNARLIAAAPELLATACEARDSLVALIDAIAQHHATTAFAQSAPLYDASRRHLCMLDTLRATIAKAKGR